MLVSPRAFSRPDGALVSVPPLLLTSEAVDSRRLVPLDGAFNFRDLGGYRTETGQTVRWKQVYRSDHLNLLTDGDRTTIAALGLRVVIDFRLPFEREQRPSKLPDGIPVLHYGMADAPDAEAGVRRIQAALLGDEPAPGWDYWFDSYHAMLDDSAPMFVRTMTALAAPGQLPALYHCTGGKDRTGLASVLLLDLLGVSADQLLDDFDLTNLHRTPARVAELAPELKAKGVDPADVLPIIGVVRAAMADAYRRIVTEHGGAAGYLVEHGLDPAIPGRLRDLLLIE